MSNRTLVLGTAGIWLSYVSEREACRAVDENARQIKNSVAVLQACAKLDLQRLFWNADVDEYRAFVKSELARARPGTTVCVAGICARDLLHHDFGFAYQTVEECVSKGVKFRILLTHPLTEAAISRGTREDSLNLTFDAYRTTILVRDVMLSCHGAIALGGSVEARLCPISLSCRVSFLNDTAVFEPYHFGVGKRRASLDTPVFVFGVESAFYKQLQGHFEYLWTVSEKEKVTRDALGKLQASVDKLREDTALTSYLMKWRPDLFASSTGES